MSLIDNSPKIQLTRRLQDKRYIVKILQYAFKRKKANNIIRGNQRLRVKTFKYEKIQKNEFFPQNISY